MPGSIHDGLLHHQAGRFAEAEKIYREILQREPNNADALHLLGVLAYQLHHFPPAADLISRAIAIRPDVPLYHNNLGNVMRSLGRRADAAACYDRAAQFKPDYADALINLGTILREQARFGDAVHTYERGLRVNPTLAEGHGNLGTVLKDQGRVDEAIAAYRRAFELKPSYADAQHNFLYATHFSDQFTPAEIFQAHEQWAKSQTFEPYRHDNNRSPDRRLRIGYVSADLRDHPVARFLEPLIVHRDCENFEFVCYSGVERPDEVMASLRRQVDQWHDVAALNAEQLANLIRSHQVDILVDLAGHTAGGRLETFARKPAPVQMTYLGYPDTTGLRAIDYRITDALADPPGAEARHTEPLARVEGCFLCYPWPQPISQRDRPEDVTFASFNNLAKISPTTVRLWRDVLVAVPRSRMLIKATSLGDPATRDLAADRFARLGLPMERVELLGPADTHADHLATYSRVTVALDTFPYNGTTTTCEALSMGVPVVSLFGEHHASRVGLSLLTACGLTRLATSDPRQFVQIAAQIADNPPAIALPRSDGRAFAQKMERVYRDAWTRWCDQQSRDQGVTTA